MGLFANVPVDQGNGPAAVALQDPQLTKEDHRGADT